MAEIQHGVHTYHYKHGWIPLDHFAAIQKAKGNRKLAEKYLEQAHAAGHAHGSFASTGTHKAGSGGGSHLRRADGFQPVAAEHLRREKHIAVAFNEHSRNFHLLDTERKNSAVISEAQARDIHMGGGKIIGISHSESGGTQLKIQNMANGHIYREDVRADNLRGQLSKRPVAVSGAHQPPKPPSGYKGPEVQPKIGTATHEKNLADIRAAIAEHPAAPHVHADGSMDNRAIIQEAAARAAAKRAAMKPSVGPNAQQKIDNAAKMYGAGSPQHLEAQKRFGPDVQKELHPGANDQEARLLHGVAMREGRGYQGRPLLERQDREGKAAILRAIDARAKRNNPGAPAPQREPARPAILVNDARKAAAVEAARRARAEAPKPPEQPADAARERRKLAYELQGKGRRLRNPDRLMEHRQNVQNADIGTRNRQILLRQVDAKLAKAGAAGRAQEDVAKAMEGGTVDQHFQNGGHIVDAPQTGLANYVHAHPERFDMKSISAGISKSFMVKDRATGEVQFLKDDGQADFGAIKEKVAGDVGNALGFFQHRVNLDVNPNHAGVAHHVFIESAGPVKAFSKEYQRNSQEAAAGEAIRKGSDPASFMRMVMFDYLIANDEDRHHQNFHVIPEGGGKARAAIVDHGRGFGGMYSDFENAPINANFSRWAPKYVQHSARGWNPGEVARAAYPTDREAGAAYDQIVANMKRADVEDVIKQAFSAPGVKLPAAHQANWEQLIRARYAHLTDPKNKAGIIAALKGM